MTDSANLAQRLLDNDPELRHLYLSSDKLSEDTVAKLTNALASSQRQSNANLQHIYFRNFRLNGSLDSMERLLQAACHVNNLQSLFFHCTEVPVDLMIPILQASKNRLTALGLRYCKLTYSSEEKYTAFLQALREHLSLQDVCIECCEWCQIRQTGAEEVNNRISSINKTNSFLQAISHMPTLRHVECVLANHSDNTPGRRQRIRQRFPAGVLQSLCRAPALTTLRVRNFWVPQEDVVLLCHSLLPRSDSLSGGRRDSNQNHRSHLQKLILSCDLGSLSASALGIFLQDPRCTLEHLSLRIDRMEDPDCPLLLAQGLRQQVHLSQQHGDLFNSGIQQVVPLPEPHRGLRHFHLSGTAASQISTLAKAAFCDMMQTNVTLEFVRLEVSDYVLQAQVAFYLRLNHSGRRELFVGMQRIRSSCDDTLPAESKGIKGNHEANLWTKALCQNHGDIRTLHYMLSLNPGFFASAALLAHDGQQTRERQCQHQSSLEVGIDYDMDGWWRLTSMLDQYHFSIEFCLTLTLTSRCCPRSKS